MPYFFIFRAMVDSFDPQGLGHLGLGAVVLADVQEHRPFGFLQDLVQVPLLPGAAGPGPGAPAGSRWAGPAGL